MKLLITDHGDPSVGIWEQFWELDCPFDESMDDANKEYFKSQMISIYQEYCDGNISAEYESEQPFNDINEPKKWHN